MLLSGAEHGTPIEQTSATAEGTETARSKTKVSAVSTGARERIRKSPSERSFPRADASKNPGNTDPRNFSASNGGQSIHTVIGSGTCRGCNIIHIQVHWLPIVCRSASGKWMPALSRRWCYDE